MKCQYCNSEWKSDHRTDICPFCGKILANKKEIVSLCDGIEKVVSLYGENILHEKKRFFSMILDFVPGCDKDKKLLSIALSVNINDHIYEMLKESDLNSVSIIKKKAMLILQDDAFLSKENAKHILDIFIEGVIGNKNDTKKSTIDISNGNNQKTKKRSESKNQKVKQNNSSYISSKSYSRTNYVGKRLDGRYEIQEIIGVGRMSVVYKAYDNVYDRIVAVKILKEEFWNNEEFKRRFRNESKAIALLSHENIVKVYDVNFGGSLQYIVMEYIDGITLKEYLDKIGAINWNDALYFMTQILKAVQHAHDKGIVHRDIRPQNIILLSNGSLKVTDFGIERYSETNSLTRYSNQYVSPEIVLGNFENEKSDIYAAGVVLYEMLVGALPLQNEPIDTVITSIRSNIKRLKKANQEIPTGLEQICVRATQKDPIDRYENAYEMICDIESVVEDPNVIFKYPLSLREYLLRLPKGYLSYKRTLGLFLPFLDSLIETNQNKNIDLCPDNIYYLCIKNKLVFDKEVAQEINIGYSAIETHKRKIRNETAIVYSIAACMYRTLVGCNPPSAVDRELDDKLLIPNEIADNIPSCVIRALAGALQVHPNDRTKTISEFRQALSFEFENDKTKKSTYSTQDKGLNTFEEKNTFSEIKSDKNKKHRNKKITRKKKIDKSEPISILYILLGLFIPIIAFIAFFFVKKDHPRNARIMMLCSIIMMIISYILPLIIYSISYF